MAVKESNFYEIMAVGSVNIYDIDDVARLEVLLEHLTFCVSMFPYGTVQQFAYMARAEAVIDRINEIKAA